MRWLGPIHRIPPRPLSLEGCASKRMRRYNAFTLIELLVAVAVIAMLLSILLPGLGRAKQEGRRVVCLNNLRQMGMAAQVYADQNNDYYPVAYDTPVSDPPSFTIREWDFIRTKNYDTGEITVKPGLLWQGKTILKVHQCPSFYGNANSPGDPYTGYNYNTSYIGGISTAVPPARVSDVRRPDACALFGDGEYASGANKFMRAPWPNPRDAAFFGRSAGTQGFRHLGKTNVVWCDGHGSSLSKAYKKTDPVEVANIADGTGFLSSDNSLYDLE